MNRTEWECTDLRCTHFDGDICRHSGETCEPDILPVQEGEGVFICGHKGQDDDCVVCLQYRYHAT